MELSKGKISPKHSVLLLRWNNSRFFRIYVNDLLYLHPVAEVHQCHSLNLFYKEIFFFLKLWSSAEESITMGQREGDVVSFNHLLC